MNKLEKRFCVYTHTRPDTGQIFYVGMGRKQRPYWTYKRNSHWNSIVAKNGGDFIVNIIIENQLWNDCLVLEVALIERYGRTDIGTGILCNQTRGGEGRCGSAKTTKTAKNAEECEKRRLRMMGKQIHLGIKHTQEAKKRMSKAQLNRSPEWKARIKASRKIVDEAKKLKTACLRRINQLKALQRGDIKKTELWKVSQTRRIASDIGFTVDQICPKTNATLATFLNMKIAAKILNTSQGSISNVCAGRRNSAGGFFWKKNYCKDTLSNLLDIVCPMTELVA